MDCISNGYTLITIHESKPRVFFAFKYTLYKFYYFGGFNFYSAISKIVLYPIVL